MMTDQLAFVEAHLGSVDIWASYLLRYMFLLEPNSHAMKKVPAFMYGNNVRLSEPWPVIMHVKIFIRAALKRR